MKPNSGPNNFRRGDDFPRGRKRNFPITDCNYQAFSLDRFGGELPDKPAPSFLNISREYFRYEARRSFLAEAAFFLAFVAILALTFISGAMVIIHFLNLPES
jgi:hypothetical protein